MNKSVNPIAQAWGRFKKNHISFICMLLGLIILLICMLAPALSPYDPLMIDTDSLWEAPSKEHLLGTDNVGRDLLSRILFGGRTTLCISFAAVAVSLIGVILGVIAGFYGGNMDFLVLRVAEALSSIPVFLMAIVFEIAFGWGKGYFAIALGLAMIPPAMRFARNLSSGVKDAEFVLAARALGVREEVIIARHVITNIAPQMIVYVTGSISDAMINCTILGYLNIGIRAPYPEWGSIIRQGFKIILASPHIAVITSSIMTVTILCYAIAGNGIRDAFATNERSY